jgi:uncharacterized protein
MPRPAGVQNERYIDATHCAHAELALAKDFALSALPRLQEAGALQRTSIALRLKFRVYAHKPAIEGELSGSLELVCQRCLGTVQLPVQESFKVIIVADEAALAQEFEEYEPIIADAVRLDLDWLAEEQGLLAMPLVARHEPGECGVGPQPTSDDAGTQRPFGNLRDMMRGR